MRNPDFQQLEERDQALTIACRACGAKASEPCMRTDYDGTRHELLNLPAHITRTKRATRLQRMATEENLTMTTDGLFEVATPEWSDLPVTSLVTSLHRGRIVILHGTEARFNGTSRGGNAAAGLTVTVYGTDTDGMNRKQTFAETDTVVVKAEQS